jgi:hypothetical protein
MTPDWSRKFDEPVTLPRGRQLVTLRDAGSYIAKLPEAEHTAPEWQAAMEALILVATLGVPNAALCAMDRTRAHGGSRPNRVQPVERVELELRPASAGWKSFQTGNKILVSSIRFYWTHWTLRHV